MCKEMKLGGDHDGRKVVREEKKVREKSEWMIVV
jgi:hypothetical protein